jgi:hypothetical protein
VKYTIGDVVAAVDGAIDARDAGGDVTSLIIDDGASTVPDSSGKRTLNSPLINSYYIIIIYM